MLEIEGVLRTWMLPRPPENATAFECESLADHRMAYLDYEGAVSGGRGDVTRWDRGVYAVERQDDAEWIVELSGEKIAGRAVLLRSTAAANRWLFSFRQAECTKQT
jgi:hypothetical protein